MLNTLNDVCLLIGSLSRGFTVMPQCVSAASFRVDSCVCSLNVALFLKQKLSWVTVLPQSLLPFAFSTVQVVESSLGSAQSSRGSSPAWGCSFWTPPVRMSGPACFRWPGPGTRPRVCAYCPLGSASLVVSEIHVF